MNAYLGKQLNLSHCKIIVFSEEVAFNGIEDQIYTLINDVQVRPSTNIIVSTCDAYSYIENSKPTLENLTTKYYDIFPSSGTYTGYTYNATIGDFFNSIVCDTCESYAILGGLNSSSYNSYYEEASEEVGNIKSNDTTINGERGAKNIGLAVFRDGHLVGELNALETICFSTLRDSVNVFLITIPDPFDSENYLDISIYPKSKIKVNVDIINDSPYISLNGNFEGKIISMQANSDYLSDENLDTISEIVNIYIEDMFSNYLYKTSKELKSDVNGFGKYALSQFSSIEKMKNYNWLNNYQHSTFNVKFNTKVQSGFLLTKT